MGVAQLIRWSRNLNSTNKVLVTQKWVVKDSILNSVYGLRKVKFHPNSEFKLSTASDMIVFIVFSGKSTRRKIFNFIKFKTYTFKYPAIQKYINNEVKKNKKWASRE